MLKNQAGIWKSVDSWVIKRTLCKIWVQGSLINTMDSIQVSYQDNHLFQYNTQIKFLKKVFLLQETYDPMAQQSAFAPHVPRFRGTNPLRSIFWGFFSSIFLINCFPTLSKLYSFKTLKTSYCVCLIMLFSSVHFYNASAIC